MAERSEIKEGGTASLDQGSQGGPSAQEQLEITKLETGEIEWIERSPPPDYMTRGSTVVQGNTAYFTLYDTYEVWSYCSTLGEEKWRMLPENPFRAFGLTVIDDLLTSIGGYNFSEGWTASLFSLCKDGEKQQQVWESTFPPMKTPRQNPACITTESVLVVAGGLRYGGRCRSNELNTVEVMDLHTKQWTTVAPLPRKQTNLSGVIHCGTLYVGAGESSSRLLKSVFACSVSALLASTDTIGSKIRRLVSPSQHVWREVASLPLKSSTLASFGGHLLAIGGFETPDRVGTNVRKYDPESDSWSVFSNVSNGLSRCFTVNLPGERLAVVGASCMFYGQAKI